MFINTTISEIDKKSGLSLRTGKSLSCVLNLGYVSEITQHGSGSRFYWTGGLNRRDGEVRMTCSTSVSDMITAINNGYNPTIYTATAYRNNNPTRGTYSVAIPIVGDGSLVHVTAQGCYWDGTPSWLNDATYVNAE